MYTSLWSVHIWVANMCVGSSRCKQPFGLRFTPKSPGSVLAPDAALAITKNRYNMGQWSRWLPRCIPPSGRSTSGMTASVPSYHVVTCSSCRLQLSRQEVSWLLMPPLQLQKTDMIWANGLGGYDAALTRR